MFKIEILQRKGFWKQWKEAETFEEAAQEMKHFFNAYPEKGILSKVIDTKYMKLNGEILTREDLASREEFEFLWPKEEDSDESSD